MWDELKLNNQTSDKSQTCKGTPFFKGLVRAVTSKEYSPPRVDGHSKTCWLSSPVSVDRQYFLLSQWLQKEFSNQEGESRSVIHRRLFEWIIFKIIILLDFHLYTKEGSLCSCLYHTFHLKLWAKHFSLYLNSRKYLEKLWGRYIETVCALHRDRQ